MTFGSRTVAFVAVLVVVATSLGSRVASAAEAGNADRPNIVLVMVDDLGFADLGCYGSEIETPNLDSLAKQGLRFSQFYNTAKCHSSRVSLMSGLYCMQAGNESLSRAVTIGEVARDAGYFTIMAGKWHLQKQPTDRGFDRYFGHLSGATNYFVGDDTFRLNGEKWDAFDDDFYTTDADTDFAMQFVGESLETDKPFLLYLAYNAPHYPLQAKKADIEKYLGRYDIGWDELRKQRYQRQLDMGLVKAKWEISPRPDHVPAWDDLTDDERAWESKRMAVFAAMVDCVDQNIGRLVAHLKEKGVWENTLFMFCSDNGACPFERTKGREYDPWDARSHWTYDTGWAHAGNTPFRWYKQNQHEGGISSPMIAHWPAGLKAEPGSITDQPGHIIDFMATIVDVTGATYPSEFDGRAIDPLMGRSLLPILQGETREPHEWIYQQFSNNRAIRKGPWKLVSARGGPWELYNIDEDRTELHMLNDEHPELVEELRALWHDVAENIEHAPENVRKPVGEKFQSFPPRPNAEK